MLFLQTHPDTTEWVETVRDGWNILAGAGGRIAGVISGTCDTPS